MIGLQSSSMLGLKPKEMDCAVAIFAKAKGERLHG